MKSRTLMGFRNFQLIHVRNCMIISKFLHFNIFKKNIFIVSLIKNFGLKLLNATIDACRSYRECLPSYQRRDPTAVVVPPNLRPFPLYISALLKSEAFRYIDRKIVLQIEEKKIIS